MTRKTGGRDVLILVENLSVPFDRRVWMEATSLQRHSRQVHVICPVTKQDPKRFEVLEGVRIHRFPLPFEGRGAGSMLAEYAWALGWMSILTVRVALRHRIATVQICNPPDILFVPALIAKAIRRSAIVFDQHDLCPEVWEAKGHSTAGFFGRALRIAEALTYRFSDLVISTNASYKEIAETRGGMKAGAVAIVRSAPPRSFAVQSLRTTRPAAEAKRLSYLGTMGHQEGIDLLLKAVALLKTDLDHPNVALDLVGSGPERQSLEALALELGLEQNVTFHGRLPDAEMRSILLQSDIAVNPDRPSKLNSLSSMNKIVEYMALGLPIVQFDGIEGRRTALDASIYVAEPTPAALASSMASLLGDEATRERMSDFGLRRFVKELCWEEQEPQLLEAYARVA